MKKIHVLRVIYVNFNSKNNRSSRKHARQGSQSRASPVHKSNLLLLSKERRGKMSKDYGVCGHAGILKRLSVK